ncbi:hypothetical protein LAWASA_926 [Lawsonibacter asaccharolyticus]|nr:hypothetical protein LAWASA_926 [Lawsonibacter asaccharolyticus]
MRNLKRALSLALASVMLLGMMVVGSSAKGIDDFTDKAEIVNQDAVAVTSAIGMFEGYEDGSFGPENVVTRAEMAVIICTMLYGAGVNVNQFAETNVFTDVPAWAQGYVNLCSSLGIVAGVGDGKFDPNATVTTAQAVLMLCRALGYFQSAADFGSDWMLAATAKGTALGLYGDLKLTANAGLTRDNVAELVFNALTKAVPVQYNELLGVYYNENQGIIYSLEFNYLQTLGYKNFDLVYRTDTETIYGRPATTWGTGSYNARTDAGTTQKDEYLTENGGLIADKVRMLDKDEIITVPNTPDYIYTNGTDESDVYADLGAAVCNDARGQQADEEYTWTAFINGEEQDDEIIPGKNVDEKWEYTDKGAVVEIYIDDYTLDVTVVEINYYLGEVSNVKTDDDDADYITVRALSEEPSLDDNTFYTTDFAEDDYVVFTVDFNEDEDFYICELMAPETVTGQVTRVQNEDNSENTYVRLSGDDGKYYYTALDTHMVYDVSDPSWGDKHPELNVEYVLYLTPEGYVLGFEPAEESIDQYLYVDDSDEELKDWVARVYLPDGTTAKVDVKSKVRDLPELEDGDFWPTNFNSNGFDADDEIQWVKKDEKTVSGIDNLIWKYSVSNSDVYTLTYAEDQYYYDGAEIHNGKAYIDAGDEDFKLIVDRKTIFVDVNGEVAYTGYDEVPNVENAEIAYVLDGDNNEKADGKIAEVVFILDGEIYDDNATYFVLADTDRESGDYDDDDYYWEYENAYVDGQKQSVFVTYDAVNDLYGSPRTVLKEGVLYKATQTIEDGQYISKLEEAAAKVSGEPTAVGDNAFWIDDANDKEHKFDTDEETIYVTVRKLVDVKGNVEWKIDDGDIDDLKDLKSDKNTTYSAKDAWVMKTVDDETARLVYIFWTETEKGDTRDITFTGSDFTVKSESATTSVDGKVATVNDKGMDAKFSISAADGYDLVSVKLEDGTVLTAKDGVYTIKNVTKDMKVEVTTKAIVKADGTVTLNGDGTITVTYEGEMPALEAAIAAIEKKLADEGYKNVTISKAGSTYTFSGQDKLGYDSKFTWDVDTDLVEVITYTLNGKETTAPAGETITYTSNWIVVNGEGVQTDVIPEAGDVILTNQIKITEDTEVTFIASGEKYTVKGTDDGSTYAKVDANYVKYGDETIALTADTVVTDGYVSVTIDDAEAVYKTTGDADVDSLKGTGTGYVINDVYAAGDTWTVDVSKGDVVIKSGYVKVTYAEGSNVTGPAYVEDDATEVEISYTVSGLQAGDPVTVNFGGTNVTSSQQDSFTAVATEMTRNFDLQIDAAGTDVVDITATI